MAAKLEGVSLAVLAVGEGDSTHEKVRRSIGVVDYCQHLRHRQQHLVVLGIVGLAAIHDRNEADVLVVVVAARAWPSSVGEAVDPLQD